MVNPKPTYKKYDELLLEIRKGMIKIPKFQRRFVWKTEETAKLLDSILRGFPIGTFILWKSKTRLASVKDLGGIKLPDTPAGEAVQYVLDGQQRLASLFVSIDGRKVQNQDDPKKYTDYKEFYINLEKDPDSNFDENLVTFGPPAEKSITVYDLLTQDLTWFTTTFPEKKLHPLLSRYKNSFSQYDFSIIEINDANLEKAVEIFNRINTTGKELTTFEIMVALTYDETLKFDLFEKHDTLQYELDKSDYQIPDKVLLQTISAFLEDNCKQKTILSLDKSKIINIWDTVVRETKNAIDYFKTQLKIPVYRLLPYNVLVLPFAYFFFKNGKPPDANQIKLLNEYFWKCSFSERFSSAVESKMEQDITKINDIVNNVSPTYSTDYNFNLQEEDLRWTKFQTGRALCKGILSILASNVPKSFINNQPVRLDNSNLTQSNSKNYHHFFPRDYLKKQNIPNANVISNITLISAFDNQSEIRTDPPSMYITNFKKKNSIIEQTLLEHLIGNLQDFGILNDNYEEFIKKRTSFIYHEIKSRIGN